MRLNRVIIKGKFAHFKVPARGKIQQTYEVPPISTVVGILKNIYGEDINDFIIGYIVKCKCKNEDLMTIYKEFNVLKRSPADRDRFMSDMCIVEYLYDVELIIYTSINQNILLEEVLTLGKANCLARIGSIDKVELKDIEGYGYNQYTDKSIGDGQIRRINTLTKFNEERDMYDITSSLVRENSEFKYNKNYDEDFGQNIYLWNWKDGVINGID